MGEAQAIYLLILTDQKISYKSRSKLVGSSKMQEVRLPIPVRGN